MVLLRLHQRAWPLPGCRFHQLRFTILFVELVHSDALQELPLSTQLAPAMTE
jgi:hypothetical protein